MDSGIDNRKLVKMRWKMIQACENKKKSMSSEQQAASGTRVSLEPRC